MVITNYGKNRITLLIGGSILNINSIPGYFLIGSGSGTALVTQTQLVTPTDRQLFTSTSYPSSQKVNFVGDWTSVEMSGLSLREIGVTVSGGGLTGSVWSRIGFPATLFDGTNELHVEETWEVI